MKAAQISSYGGPEVIKVNEVESPTPGSGQVLIRVKASSINPYDIKIRSGAYQNHMALQFPVTLGGDIAGSVEALGEGVDGLEVGDKVFGQANFVAGNSGAFAEYAVTNAREVAKMPSNVDFVQAASLALAGVSALQGITELAKLKPGQKVLVMGGSGGIGTIAVEVAKHIGAYVAATVSPSGVEAVKALGADEVIDYKNQDYTQLLSGYDVVFNTTGADVTPAFAVLKQGGIAVSMSGSGDEAAAAAKSITSIGQATQVNVERLHQLTELVETGIVTPQIAKVFTLDQIVEAFKFKEQGGTTGKVALTI